MRLLPLLAAVLAAALPARAQQSRPEGLASLAGDRAELIRLFDAPGQLGVIQVAGGGAGLEASLPLYPRYAGLASELGFATPAPAERLEDLAASAGSPAAIAAPDDLRDALAATPAAMPPAATQLPPLSLLKASGPKTAAPPALGPAGWLVLTRRGAREVRPLATREDVARWTAAAELQRRAYEDILTERFAKNLGRLGTPPKPAQ